jgi:hypothetical protein
LSRKARFGYPRHPNIYIFLTHGCLSHHIVGHVTPIDIQFISVPYSSFFLITTY